MGMESIVQERQTFSSKLNEIQQALIRNTYIILVEREIKSQIHKQKTWKQQIPPQKSPEWHNHQNPSLIMIS
jgi:hypothetical protein